MPVATVWYTQAQVPWFALDLKTGPMKAPGAFIRAFLYAVLGATILAIAVGWKQRGLRIERKRTGDPHCPLCDRLSCSEG